MAQSSARHIFGIHSAVFYNPITLQPYGMVKVLGNGTFEMKGEQIDLRGGSAKFPFSTQQGNIDANINLTLKEYPDFIMQLFLGKAPTAASADATGTVLDIVNWYGTSIKSASAGIAAVIATSGDEADLKFGKYMVKATDTTKVKIYGLSGDVDFSRGTDVSFEDDALLIGTEITVAAGANLVAALGITITGGTTPAFTVGDTGFFEVLPIHSGASSVTIGGLNDVFPTFGVILTTQQLGNGEMFEIDCPNCSAAGLNLGGAEKAFTETPLTAKVSYSSLISGVAKIRSVKPT